MNSQINRNASRQVRQSAQSKQQGMALLSIVILMLVVVGLLSMTASQSTILETKMVFNLQDKQRSLIAADSSALFGVNEALTNLNVKIAEIIKNNAHPGYYVLGDKIISNEKIASDWKEIRNVITWPWEDDTKRFVLPSQLGGTANPMKLQANPQYVIGMHNPVVRKGTAGFNCVPVSIIGASKGGTANTRTLIEMKAIPKSGCYFGKIK